MGADRESTTTRWRGAGRAVAAVAILGALVVPAVAPAAPAPTLTPERFAALEPLFELSVPLESDAPTAADVAALRQGCAGLPTTDALLDAQARGCASSLQVLAASDVVFHSCTSPRSCAAAAHTLRRVLVTDLAESRRANRVVTQEVAPGACRALLRMPATEAKAEETMIAALGHMERGLRRASTRELSRGMRLLDRADALDANVPSATKRLARFRAHCR